MENSINVNITIQDNEQFGLWEGFWRCVRTYLWFMYFLWASTLSIWEIANSKPLRYTIPSVVLAGISFCILNQSILCRRISDGFLIALLGVILLQSICS